MNDAEMPTGDGEPDFAPALRVAAERLPKPVGLRMLSALLHSDKALALLPVDREMASFRAITGEEEAASALIRAVQMRKYLLASRLDHRDHRHKAAIVPFVVGVRSSLAQGIPKLNVTFDLTKPRIDVHLPFTQFGVAVSGDETLGIRPVEPLDIHSMRRDPDGQGEIPNQYSKELSDIAQGAEFNNIKSYVKARANSRNTLLYASDSALPQSQATERDLLVRRGHTLLMLGLSVIVMQTSAHQALVTRGVEVLLDILDRLPKDTLPKEAGGALGFEPSSSTLSSEPEADLPNFANESPPAAPREGPAPPRGQRP